MKYIILLFLTTTTFLIYSQNVGINQSNPTNSLHVSPVNLGDNPLRIDGVQTYSVGDTSLLMINTTTGIVKYINPSDFVSIISGGAGLGTDDQNIDSLILNGLTLTTFIESGNSANVDLTPVSDSAVNYIINNSDTLFSNSSFVDSIVSIVNNNTDSLFSNQNFIDSITTLLYNNADTLLSNSTFINNLRDSIDTDVDSIILTGTTLTIYENGGGVFVDLSSLSDADADPQNEIQDLNLTGNNLTITNNSSPTSIDLSPYLDNTDAQTLSLSGNNLSISNGNSVTLTDNVNDADSDATNELQTISKSGSTVTLSNGGGSFTDDDTQLTEAQVDAYANNNGYLTSFTEVDGSVTNELQNLSLSGTTLSISSGNNVNLGGLNDHDWYEVGGTSQPDNINDNIYTQGNVGIGVSTPTTKLEVVGTLSVSRGSLSSPAYTFINDLSTGIFQPTQGELGIVTGNSKYRAHFSANEIRVGTNLNSLDVGSESKFIIEGSENTPSTGTKFASLGFSNQSNQSGQSGSEIAKVLSSSHDGTTNQGRLEFQTKDGTTLNTNMMIDKEGDVSIGNGNTNPNHRLEVIDRNNPVEVYIRGRGMPGQPYDAAIVFDDDGASGNGYNGQGIFMLADYGNSKSEWFAGKPSSIGYSWTNNFGDSYVISRKSLTSAGHDNTVANPGNILLRVINNGNVGIGTTTPTSLLDVNGNARIRSIPTTTSTSVTPLYSDASGNIFKKTSTFNSGVNGFSILPSGMIMQWGTLTNVPLNQSYNTVTFPTAFPNACRNVQATIHRNNPINGTVATVVRNVSTTGCQIAGDHDTSSSTGNINWFAIGF